MIKERFLCIAYTWNHKVAFLKVEKELRGFNTLRGYMHDVDKLFLFVILFWKNKKEIQKMHRKFSRHHDNGIAKSKEDYINMVIDWECARETKPDKPLNAYDTMKKLYPHLEVEIVPILREFGLID